MCSRHHDLQLLALLNNHAVVASILAPPTSSSFISAITNRLLHLHSARRQSHPRSTESGFDGAGDTVDSFSSAAFQRDTSHNYIQDSASIMVSPWNWVNDRAGLALPVVVSEYLEAHGHNIGVLFHRHDMRHLLNVLSTRDCHTAVLACYHHTAQPTATHEMDHTIWSFHMLQHYDLFLLLRSGVRHVSNMDVVYVMLTTILD